MGQYHLTVNLTKREFISPHELGCGLKLMEQFGTAGGTGGALLLLLGISANGRGGGDPRAEDPNGIIGRWGGDRIAIVGDYAEDSDLADYPVPASQIYSLCNEWDDLDEFSRHAARIVNAARERGELVDPDTITPFADITPIVAEYIEREEGGRFIGAGWKRFVTERQEVMRWNGSDKEMGEVIKLTATDVSVEWPNGIASYKTNTHLPFF
jgi:hypothetical protein